MSLNLPRQKHPMSSCCAGFSLIEVLVSLTILALGLLGMTGLQNEALKHNQAAFTESQAQFLLMDMMERIRANAGSKGYAIGFTEAAPAASMDCASTACSSAQMAAWDIVQWRALVEDSAYLPQGEGAIDYDALSSTYTLSIRYDWSQLGGEGISGGKRTVTLTSRI